MPAKIFITGTDTHVGKTHVSAQWLKSLHEGGVRACGFKPVSSGDDDDALLLQTSAGLGADYQQNPRRFNPYRFALPASPHIACGDTRIEWAIIDHALQQLDHEVILVEGAGGWHCPLNEQGHFSDWVAHQGLPVVLVVGMRLGCLNHALLSAQAIQRQSRLLGWVANVLPPTQPHLAENITWLEQNLPAPRLQGVWEALGLV